MFEEGGGKRDISIFGAKDSAAFYAKCMRMRLFMQGSLNMGLFDQSLCAFGFAASPLFHACVQHFVFTKLVFDHQTSFLFQIFTHLSNSLHRKSARSMPRHRQLGRWNQYTTFRVIYPSRKKLLGNPRHLEQQLDD